MMHSLCGLDEAGRGPLAGPLVAAAVILPADFDFVARFPKVRFGDSKTLSPRQREAAYCLIEQHALALAVEVIDVPDIDARGMGWANKAVFERLIVAVNADRYVVDGNLKLQALPGKSVACIVRADQSVPSVSAASIIAKVTRDRLMHDLHAVYPDYGWERNRGYGTAAHIAAIREHGATPQHRIGYTARALAKPPRLPPEPTLPGL